MRLKDLLDTVGIEIGINVYDQDDELVGVFDDSDFCNLSDEEIEYSLVTNIIAEKSHIIATIERRTR